MLAYDEFFKETPQNLYESLLNQLESSLPLTNLDFGGRLHYVADCYGYQGIKKLYSGDVDGWIDLDFSFLLLLYSLKLSWNHTKANFSNFSELQIFEISTNLISVGLAEGCEELVNSPNEILSHLIESNHSFATSFWKDERSHYTKAILHICGNSFKEIDFGDFSLPLLCDKEKTIAKACSSHIRHCRRPTNNSPLNSPPFSILPYSVWAIANHRNCNTFDEENELLIWIPKRVEKLNLYLARWDELIIAMEMASFEN